MKAIFIPDLICDINELNRELKDCIDVAHTVSTSLGTLLICTNFTRKDKLVEIEKKSKEHE